MGIFWKIMAQRNYCTAQATFIDWQYLKEENSTCPHIVNNKDGSCGCNVNHFVTGLTYLLYRTNLVTHQQQNQDCPIASIVHY